MKRLLVGLLVLGSVSAFGKDFYRVKIKIKIQEVSVKRTKTIGKLKGVAYMSSNNDYCELILSTGDKVSCISTGSYLDYLRGVGSRIDIKVNSNDLYSLLDSKLEDGKYSRFFGSLSNNRYTKIFDAWYGYNRNKKTLVSNFPTERVTSVIRLVIKASHIKD